MQNDYSRSEYLALTITQIVIIVILFVFLIVWHIRHAKKRSDAAEIERAYIHKRSLEE